MKYYNTISSDFEIIQALSNGIWEVYDNSTGRTHEVTTEWLENQLVEVEAVFAESAEEYHTDLPSDGIDWDVDEVARADAEEFGDFSENEGRVNLAE